MTIVFNATSSPARVALYTGGDDNPMADPIGNLSRVHFHSDLDYIATVAELSTTVAIPATDADLLQTFVVGSHGQAGVPLVFGYAEGWGGGGLDLPLVGSTIVFSNSDGNCIFATVACNSTQVLLEVHRSRATLGGGISLPVRVLVTDKILE